MKARILCRLIRVDGRREDAVGHIEEAPTPDLALFRYHEMLRRLGRTPGYHRLTLQARRRGRWRNVELHRITKGGKVLQHVRRGKVLELPEASRRPHG